jgi:hypothetical protein
MTPRESAGSTSRPEGVAPTSPVTPTIPAASVPAPAPRPVPGPVAAPPKAEPGGNGPAPVPPPINEPPPSPSAPVAGSRSLGAWSSLVDWPLIAIHAALLPDGRVMTYGTNESRSGYSRFYYDIFDPKLDPATPDSHLTLENSTGTFLFCSAQLVLPMSGELLLTGGDVQVNGTLLNRGVRDVNVFNPANNALRPASGKMNRPRWYGSATTLPNGDTYVQGGVDGEDHPEIRSADGTFRLLEGVDTLKTGPAGDGYFANNYPRNFVTPKGKIFGLDHHYLYEIDPYGTGDGGKAGSLTVFKAHWDIPNTRGGDSYRGWSNTSTAVMHRPGKILQLGGTQRNATEIDFNGPVPVVRDLPPMSEVRQWSTATLMPDGKVFVSGGSTLNVLNDPASFPGEVAYDTAIFDPATETWSRGAPVAVPRLYHSVSLLLPDGTILSSGGGSPGPVTNLNAQVYSPGYLFKQDGSRAVRPVIDQVPNALPAVVNPATGFDLTSRDAAGIRRVTMIKSGAVTHSIDMDQRFLELSFSVNGDQIHVDLPKNAFETPPGFYMVFILDAAGTPSKARMIRINPVG